MRHPVPLPPASSSHGGAQRANNSRASVALVRRIARGTSVQFQHIPAVQAGAPPGHPSNRNRDRRRVAGSRVLGSGSSRFSGSQVQNFRFARSRTTNRRTERPEKPAEPELLCTGGLDGIDPARRTPAPTRQSPRRGRYHAHRDNGAGVGGLDAEQEAGDCLPERATGPRRSPGLCRPASARDRSPARRRPAALRTRGGRPSPGCARSPVPHHAENPDSRHDERDASKDRKQQRGDALLERLCATASSSVCTA